MSSFFKLLKPLKDLSIVLLLLWQFTAVSPAPKKAEWTDTYPEAKPFNKRRAQFFIFKKSSNF